MTEKKKKYLIQYQDKTISEHDDMIEAIQKLKRSPNYSILIKDGVVLAKLQNHYKP